MLKENVEALVNAIQKNLKDLNEEEVEALIRAILESERIFVHGAGRSGLVAKAFAMRLMHLGKQVYVVGETITPAMRPDDLLICVSGSGKTRTVVQIAEVAKKEVKAKVASITSNRNSPLARLSDFVVVIGGRPKKAVLKEYLEDQIRGVGAPITPLGTLFEVSAQIFLDSLVVTLMQLLGESEERMRRRHANLE